jgi:predicted aspartyl protease
MLVRFPLLWLLTSLSCFPCQAAKDFTAVSEGFAVPFRSLADGLIIVPVMVNGSGPFDFVLDTGSSATAIDPRLAKKLALPMNGKSVDIGIKDASDRELVHIDTLSVGKGTVTDLDVMARENVIGAIRRLSGTLGEDYLRKFDLIIDNRQHIVIFDPNPGSLALGLQGEHLEVTRQGTYRGGQTRDRVILRGHSDEFGSTTFLVDSGATNLIVLLPPSKWRLLGFPFSSLITDASGRTKDISVRTQFVGKLSFGEKHLRNLTAIALSSEGEADVDAFLPTRIFDRIFICHSDNYVILDPTSKRR